MEVGGRKNLGTYSDMPKSFLVKKASRSKRRLEEEPCEGRYLLKIHQAGRAVNSKGQLASVALSRYLNITSVHNVFA